MKNSIKSVMTALLMLSFGLSNAQIKNAKTENVKVYGNCEMCETTIEKAGNLKRAALVDWNKDTKMATITYNANKTNQDEILKRIALAGYDSDNYLAPDDVYAKLPGCCMYERVNKPISKSDMETETLDHSNHTTTTETPEVNQLEDVFDNYFSIKDALVKSDGNMTSIKAKELSNALVAVQMNKLTVDEHTVWMNIIKDLMKDAEQISSTGDVADQRNHFMRLSKNIYELIKVSKIEVPVYYQHCPMANNGKGANWLSKENSIKNPYYGSQMLTCGSTIEIIK